LTSNIALTVFQGLAGDHNNLGIPGAASLGDMLAARLGAVVTCIGSPGPALSMDWEPELKAALSALRLMEKQLDSIFRQGQVPVTALSRCAVSLSTLPVVARHRPEVCVVWFDAHADLNTPDTTTSGYLGGLALSGPLGLWDTGLGAGLRGENVVLVGARDIDPPEQALIDAGLVRWVQCGPDLANRLRDAVAGRPVYVHLDCDVLEPGIVPTEFKAPGGLSLADLYATAELLAMHEVVGLEISEFQSVWEEGEEPVSPANLIDALQPLLDRLQIASPQRAPLPNSQAPESGKTS